MIFGAAQGKGKVHRVEPPSSKLKTNSKRQAPERPPRLGFGTWLLEVGIAFEL
jgi:hypothetical protein